MIGRMVRGGYGVYYRANDGRLKSVEFDNTELLELLLGGDRKLAGNESLEPMKKLVRKILDDGAWPDEY